MKKLVLLFSALAVVTLGSTMWNSAAAQHGKYKEVALNNPDGKEVKLSDVVAANKYTLLDFWATWCGPCMREMPVLKEAYAKYHDKGFEIYAVSYDKDGEAWKAGIEKNTLNWIHVSSLNGWNCPTKEAYGIRSIPANFLIDSKGNIVATNLRGEAVMEKLDELIK